MTLMNCKRAGKLMPLYAAGDLPAGRLSRAVAAHVARCGACAALSAEFRASREWAREAGDVPEFGEEFYESLRAGVLDRVRRDTRPAAPEQSAPFFPAMFAGRRLAFATSLAVAACALALVLYFLHDRGRPQRNEIVVAPSGGELVNPPQRASVTPMPDATTDEQQPSHDTPRSDEQLRQPNDERGGGGGFKRTPTLRRRSPGYRSSPPAAARAPELAAARGSARQVVATAASRAETAGVSRIEIQTADPNIRIIWLAPDEGDEAEPDRVDPDR